MQLQLHSNPSVTIDELKSAGYDEMYVLNDQFLERELAFLGCTRATFDVKAAQARAYADAGYPVLDEDVYPYIADQVTVCGCTAQEAADAILADKAHYDLMIRHTERARLSAVNHISLQGALATTAYEIFAWRHAFSLSSEMGATLDRPYVSPAPDPNYETVEATADGVDQVVITLPEQSLGDDLEVIVEAFAPPGDPWRGSYYQLHTNPGAAQALTFTTANQYLVTIRNMPRVPQQFVVDCRRKIAGTTVVAPAVAAGMTYAPAP